MRRFDALLYDPRKFFTLVIIWLWMIPLLLVSLIGFTTKAMTNANDGGGYTSTTTARTQCSGTMYGSVHQCPLRPIHQTTTSQTANRTTTNCANACQCTCRTVQPKPRATPRSTTTTTRTSIIRTPTAPKKQIVYVTRRAPVRSTTNNSARAAAAATAVVNVQTATPQAQTVAAATYSAPASVSKTLPNTGPGNVFEIAGLATVASTLGHMFYRRRRLA